MIAPTFHISFPYSSTKILKPHLLLNRPPPLVLMLDRRSSYQGDVYIPPPLRLSASSTSSSAIKTTTIASASPQPASMDSKPVCSDNTSNNPHQHLPPHFYQQQQQKTGRAMSTDSLEREIEVPAQVDAQSVDEGDPWTSKLMTFIRSSDQHELVSREKKDRRDYERISTLATQLGLYSRMYGKVVVVSKTPLPNYRFDLDDKRPQREVILPPGLHKRVDAHLEEYISDMVLGAGVSSESNSDDSIDTDCGFFEEPEPLPQCFREKTASRRSLQMRTEQQAWQVYTSFKA